MFSMSRFVLVYQGTNDPSQQEEQSLVSALKKTKVVDRMPGTILVDGDEAVVASAVSNCRDWTFSRQQSMGVAPPHRRMKQAT